MTVNLFYLPASHLFLFLRSAPFRWFLNTGKCSALFYLYSSECISCLLWDYLNNRSWSSSRNSVSDQSHHSSVHRIFQPSSWSTENISTNLSVDSSRSKVNCDCSAYLSCVCCTCHPESCLIGRWISKSIHMNCMWEHFVVWDKLISDRAQRL